MKQRRINVKWNKGIVLGLIAGLVFGTLPLLTVLNKPASLDPTIAFGNVFSVYQTSVLAIARGSVVSFFNDLMTTFFMMLTLTLLGATSNYKKLGKLIRSKAGVYTIIGGFIGGPIGNTIFLAVFVLLNPSFGTMFYALQPLFIGIIAYFSFKRSYNAKIWIALVLIIVAVIGITFSQIYGSGKPDFGKNATTVIVGVILGLLGVIAYSAESLILDKAMSLNKVEGVDGLHYLQIKGISSALLELILVMPLTSFWLSTTSPDILNNLNLSNGVQINFKALGDILSINESVNIQLIMTNGVKVPVYPIVLSILVGFFLFLARIFFYRSIKESGASTANALYQSQIIVTPIVSGILLLVGFKMPSANLYNLEWWAQLIFWILALVTLFAAIYIAWKKPPIDRLKEHKKWMKQDLNSNDNEITPE